MFQALFETYIRLPTKQCLHAGNIWTAACRIILEGRQIGYWSVGVAKLADNQCEFTDLALVGITYVEYHASCFGRGEHHGNQPRHHIVNIAVRARLFAIAIDGDGFVADGLAMKLGTERPSLGFMRGPYVLNMRTIRPSRPYSRT